MTKNNFKKITPIPYIPPSVDDQNKNINVFDLDINSVPPVSSVPRVFSSSPESECIRRFTALDPKQPISCSAEFSEGDYEEWNRRMNDSGISLDLCRQDKIMLFRIRIKKILQKIMRFLHIPLNISLNNEYKYITDKITVALLKLNKLDDNSLESLKLYLKDHSTNGIMSQLPSIDWDTLYDYLKNQKLYDKEHTI